MNRYHKIRGLVKLYPSNEAEDLIVSGDFDHSHFNLLANTPMWNCYEKIDGASIRVIFNREHGFSFKGKTEKSDTPDYLMDYLRELFAGKEGALNKYLYEGVDDICIYGEGFGGKIQGKSKLYGDNYKFYAFDVKINGKFLPQEELVILSGLLGINTAPKIAVAQTIFGAIKMVEVGVQSVIGSGLAEGIIIRPCIDMYLRNGERIIAKLRHDQYLLNVNKG